MKTKHKFNKDKLYFTSDLHFYHANIIAYDDRPFSKLEIMHNCIIDNWNKTVSKDSDVIIAGDFALTSSKDKIKDLVSQLNGRLWLVYGNHEYQNKFDRVDVKKLFYSTSDALDFSVEDDEIEDGFLKFHVNHYPCEFWTRGAIHLHGHIHSKNSAIDEKVIYKPMRYDVGVTNNGYCPISYNNVKIIITKQLLKSE